MESGFSSQAITSGAIQYGVPMKVFLRPTVLSNWALTPKSTKGVQKRRHKTSWWDFYITRCNKACGRLIYQVWLLRSRSAAHSALWYLCEWLCGHGGEKGPAGGQSAHSSQYRLTVAAVLSKLLRPRWHTLRISLQMYAIQSSFRELPLVFFTRSVTDPAPQNSITS